MLQQVLAHARHRDGDELGIAQAELILMRGEHADTVFVHGKIFGMGLAVFFRGDKVLESVHEPGVLDMPAMFFPDGMLLAVEAGLYGEFRIDPGLIVIVLPVCKIRALDLVQLIQHKLRGERNLLAGGGEETASQPFQKLVHAIDDAALSAGDAQSFAHCLQDEVIVPSVKCNAVFLCNFSHCYDRSGISFLRGVKGRGGHPLQIAA